MEYNTVAELVQKMENDYITGTTQISKYVQHSMHDTLERIDAYLNSYQISGRKDSLGRDKPFFNICIAASNVWYRATDIDQKNITIKATKRQDWLNSFLATIHLRDWMRRENFGQFLNEWGRVLARYGSAVYKCIENNGRLHISVIPWNMLIVDAVDFDSNPKIEILELTDAQLMERIETHGYDEEQVRALIDTLKPKENKDRQRKDNEDKVIKLHEIHGNLSKYYLTNEEKDKDIFVPQMHVISKQTSKTKGESKELQEFSLFSGEEKQDPYTITHLIKEDGRTLAIGSVEHLFEAQWMVNHSIKELKDTLDIASKLIFQTSDHTFIGRNALKHIETGDVLIYDIKRGPITAINNQAVNTNAQQNFLQQWKLLGNEITNVSESMLGATPKSGTAWRQTEAILQESHSLFELMLENKGLALEDMLRKKIIPFLKKKMNTSKEISDTLQQYEIDRIDSIYIKNASIRKTNRDIAQRVLRGEMIGLNEQETLQAENENILRNELANFGNQRFFKPSELSEKTWQKQFKDLEWEVEVDITGESFDTQQALTTLNTALQLVVQPGFEQNQKAKAIVGRILEMTGVMSPIEFNAIPSPVQQQPLPTTQTPEVSAGALQELTT